MTGHDEISNRTAFIFAGIANGAGWLKSFIDNNINTGAIVTFCTIAVPAMVGAAIYVIKNLGPVILQYRKDVDAQRSASMGSQMERLSQNLEDLKRDKEDEAQKRSTAERLSAMAEVNAARINDMFKSMEARANAAEEHARKLEDRAIAAEKHAEDLAEMLNTVNAKLDQISKRTEDANAKLHDIVDDKSADNTSKIADELMNKINANASKLENHDRQIDTIVHAGEQFATAMIDNVDKVTP